MNNLNVFNIVLILAISIGCSTGIYNKITGGDTLNVRVLGTGDIQTHIMNYDYYRGKKTKSFGFVKTASLIKKARKETGNNILVDSGDVFSGGPLGDYIYRKKGLKKGDIFPAIRAMNLLHYDAGNIGNRDLNYGLDYLKIGIASAKFPFVNSNLYIDDFDENEYNNRNYFNPYVIIDKDFITEGGKKVKLKVGVIGFAPPQVAKWNKELLGDEIVPADIVKTAKKYIPEIKAKGADIVVALAHSGLVQKKNRKGKEEHTVYFLSQVEGIDAIIFGHAHKNFPSKQFSGIPGVDLEAGTVHGTPSVMPGYWGNNLGVIDLKLKKRDGKWEVTDSKAHLRKISKKEDDRVISLAEVDKDIYNSVLEDHNETLDYIETQIGTSITSLNSYFVLLADNPTIEVVTKAQKWYMKSILKGTELESIPMLSASAPFKAGARGPNFYIDVPSGKLLLKNTTDLYIYQNLVKAVFINGKELRDWLDKAAGIFNTIDPNKVSDQELINKKRKIYNFDVIDGVTYEIDIRKKPKFDEKGNIINPTSTRIYGLKYNGAPVTIKDNFIVITNSYRANGGGDFPGLDGSKTVIDPPHTNLQVLTDYIIEKKNLNPRPDNNWKFSKFKTKGKVIFRSSPNSTKYLKNFRGVRLLNIDDDGFAKYIIDLNRLKRK